MDGRELRLLALAPSGETYFVEIDGVAWLMRPPGAGGARSVDPSVVDRAVTNHGFERVDRTFERAEDLDAFRNEVAARIAPDEATRPESFDEDDVRRLLGVARRWRAADDPRAGRLLSRLLEAPAALANRDLLLEIAELLKPEPAIDLSTKAPDVLGQAARERFLAAQAA